MTQEEDYPRIDEEIQAPQEDQQLPDDSIDNVVLRKERSRVKDMVLRFERSAYISSFSSSNESISRHRDSSLGSLSSILVSPLHLHSHQRSHDRISSISINSVLSNTSEVSNESSSSGFISDRKSCADFPIVHRPAPPPPTAGNNDKHENKSRERRYSISTPQTSPILPRRARQPPVIRRKSLAGGGQGHASDTHFSYGVTQGDLERLLRLKRSECSDNEESVDNSQIAEITDDDDSSEASDEQDQDGDQDETKVDTMSTDRSTDTLINDERGSDGDNSSLTSGVSGAQSNYDNVSIKSISSFDMVPYQKYDSITISSDEFGAEVCHAPDTEFLTVSAVNEWCVSNSAEPVLLPVETKKDKYRRRMTERVNELIHTEGIYVDRLRHVVEDYIPELMQDDVSPSLRVLKPDIFANIEKILKFHAEEFLPALKDCENDLRKLGQCFRRFEKRFNMYVMYSRNNKRATRLVFENKHFFLEKQLQLGDRLDLSSYLLEPVQRIPRYKLFLDDLVKTYTSYENERCESDSRISKLSVDSDETGGSNGESSVSDESPLESLKQAKTMIECVLTAIDGIMALENIRDCPPHINLMNQGRLLRQGEFYAMDPARRRRQLMRIFLFDKLVLLTAVYRKQLTVELFLYKDHIPVDDLGITAKEHDQYKFSIWYKKRTIKSYKLETRDPAFRNAWVEEITSLLWEQAMQKKELIQQQRNLRLSTVSMTSQDSDSNQDADKYNSLRGVPGEVRRRENEVRRTTWYCE